MTNYRLNKEHHGIEISFDSKPEAETIEALKQNGFRWHRGGGYWYAKQTEERIKLAEQITNGEKTEPKQASSTGKQAGKAEKKNKFGIKVGDWFEASWGYDQTNVDFFQVIELIGEQSVRVREARPEMIKQDCYGHGMAADRYYKLPKEIQPPVPHSVFIKDNEKGDIKRIKSYAADGVSYPQFYLSSYCDAHHISGDTTKTYESWYA